MNLWVPQHLALSSVESLETVELCRPSILVVIAFISSNDPAT
jgi:hypothetical protein